MRATAGVPHRQGIAGVTREAGHSGVTIEAGHSGVTTTGAGHSGVTTEAEARAEAWCLGVFAGLWQAVVDNSCGLLSALCLALLPVHTGVSGHWRKTPNLQRY